MIYYYNGEKRYLDFFSSSRLNHVSRRITILLVTGLAIGSIISLHFISGQAARLGLGAGFTFLVGVILDWCGAKKSEIIMGVVGYVRLKVLFDCGSRLSENRFAAILVVFVSTSA
jgi:hypothetical protein